MNIAEARNFVAMLEQTIGHEAVLPTSIADQATASFRDDLRELGVDSDDPQQMLAVFAGLLAASGAMVGYPVVLPVIHRMAHLLRSVMDWQGVQDVAAIPSPRRRWKPWRR